MNSDSEWNCTLPRRRWTRAASSPPEPLDCQLSAWTAWSQCDPCQKKRYRYAKLEQPSQFGGELCSYYGRDVEPCSTASACRNTRRCEGFVCAITDRCIPRRLLCNEDDDCGDKSDEQNCKKLYPACKTETEEYWGVENLGKGSVHWQLCLQVTVGKYEFLVNEYESYSSYEKDTFRSHSSQTSVSIGITLPGIFEFGFNYDDNRVKKFMQKTRSFSGTKSSFLRANSRLEVARYSLKSRGLVLHHEFFQRIKSLPLEYVYGEYREIFKDYGTHYITEATLGGIYEYTVIMNQKTMEESGYTLNDAKTCINAGMKIGANIEGVYVHGGVKAGFCSGMLKEIGDNKVKKTFVEDFVALVKGGASEYITRMAYKQLPTADLMQEWGEAVQYNPEIIDSKTEPLFQLVTGTDFANGNLIRRNMQQALEEYLAESSSCRCSQCRNNGVTVLKGTRCECVCPVGFKGDACEITQRTVSVDGSWSCWSSWSSCTNQEKRRTRQCTHPPPHNGGSPCSGIDAESTPCK
ncbi:complement component C8 beta chain-like [Acipenser ruthenus]|uniref:complement component C8 beta chain-like n=1 Tax=Acipenser ruthenus TaxID=7906 RepID=UPI00274039C0|nr:complement component C8 beta chain-like [Acipenser ruthenus]